MLWFQWTRSTSLTFQILGLLLSTRPAILSYDISDSSKHRLNMPENIINQLRKRKHDLGSGVIKRQ